MLCLLLPPNGLDMENGSEYGHIRKTFLGQGRLRWGDRAERVAWPLAHK